MLLSNSRWEHLSGSKKAMDRETVLSCPNMTSKNKVKLLVIGKSKRPHWFKCIIMDTLPVIYHANKKAWKMSVLLEEWITKWMLLGERKTQNRSFCGQLHSAPGV